MTTASDLLGPRPESNGGWVGPTEWANQIGDREVTISGHLNSRVLPSQFSDEDVTVFWLPTRELGGRGPRLTASQGWTLIDMFGDDMSSWVGKRIAISTIDRRVSDGSMQPSFVIEEAL